MKIELDLPPKTVRLLKALKELNGLSAEEMGTLAASILERGLKDQIAYELGLFSNTKGQSDLEYSVDSDISMDLGDEYDYEAEEKKEKEREQKRNKGAVTEEMLEEDLAVSNPHTEAKAEAAMSENYLFGMEDDVRALKRKKNVKSKGKVSAFTGSDSEESMY